MTKRNVLIGTAGHIDHGKTRLVGKLTNTDTDRLPEEKARGISIDLGFAHWETDEFIFGMVDVPGHERFVKNMVAGATGVNVALLVIAADDSVMPQTREHLEIMDLLGVRTGVIAITKSDLVDGEFVELVEAEIEELVEGTFLEGCPIIPVSSETGAGLDVLKQTLVDVSRKCEWAETSQFFRMPIDRVFTIEGHGTIVTGSVMSGDVQPNDTLTLLPDDRAVRVRSVQNHGEKSVGSGARQRTAINLAGMKLDELSRGRELATPGFLQSSSRLLVEVRTLSSSPIVLKDRVELSLHIGTSEVEARVVLKGKQLKPGERAIAELRTKEPIVGAYGQRFILRRISPALTVAGGLVLDPYIDPEKRIRDLQQYGESMSGASLAERLSFLLSQTDAPKANKAQSLWRAGIPEQRFEEVVNELTESKRLIQVAGGIVIHADRLESLGGSILRTIREELERRQPRRSLPKDVIHSVCRNITKSDLIEAVLTHLLKSKQLVLVGKNLGPADAQVKLSKNQQQQRTRMLESISTGGLTPPTVKELTAELGVKPDQVASLLTICVEDGLLVAVSDQLYFTPESIDSGRKLAADLIAEISEATMSQLREKWEVTRKFAVPLCEFFDAHQLTVRNGDVRVAGPKLHEPWSE